MADDIDIASDRINLEVAARLSVAPKFDTPSLTECQDCGDDIPLKRQQLGSVTHCVDCAERIEKRR